MLTKDQLFVDTVCTALRVGGFNYNRAGIVQDAMVITAWRGDAIFSVVVVSASGLEIVQNDYPAIRDLAKSRAENAMAIYDVAVKE